MQALPSLHGRLLALNWQAILLSQLSAVHGLASSQTVAAPGRQVPDRQLSPTVQALPSLQAAPFSWGTKTQSPALQAAAWQVAAGQVVAVTHSGGVATSVVSAPVVSPSAWTSAVPSGTSG